MVSKAVTLIGTAPGSKLTEYAPNRTVIRIFVPSTQSTVYLMDNSDDIPVVFIEPGETAILLKKDGDDTTRSWYARGVGGLTPIVYLSQEFE